MRICAVSFPELRVEVVRATEPSKPAPLGIVVAAPNSPLALEARPETKLLGNTRLDVVSREARALGVTAGQTIAQARARAGGALSVRVVRSDAVREVLARLAEIGLAFGATVSFGLEGDPDKPFGDVVWVDVTGCAHLHADTQAAGEAILATRLVSAFSSLGHTCAAVIADGPRVAAILARVAASQLIRENTRAKSRETPDVIVVPPGENARALEGLPLGALPLASNVLRWIVKLGIRTIGELRTLPRSGLATRLGPEARDLLALIDGDDRAPLTPWVPPEIPEEEATLEYGIEGTQALTFVAKTLTDRLGARLAGRAVATTRIELLLALDAGMLEDSAREDATQIVALDLPAPLSSASDMLSALRPKLERLVLRAPVLAAKLRAPALVHKREAALSLFEAQPKAERALPRLVAELAADLGPEAVGKLALGDSWSPTERSRFVTGDILSPRSDRAATKKPRRHLLSSVPEPTRMLAEPMPIARENIRIVRHLTRTEATEWWKLLPGDRIASMDYVFAWTDDGAAFVEIQRGTGLTRVRGWFD